MKASINFKSLGMKIGEQVVAQLPMGDSGHIQLPFIDHSTMLEPRTDDMQTEKIWAADEPGGKMSVGELQKVHRHLGHATVSPTKQILHSAKRRSQEEDSIEVVRKCGCSEMRSVKHASIANQHFPQHPGNSVFRIYIILLKEAGINTLS